MGRRWYSRNMCRRVIAVAGILLAAGSGIVANRLFGPESVSAQSHRVSLQRFDDRVEVALNGQALTTFHFHSRWDKPFLYPLRTTSGVVVSRGYPVEPRPGEQQDHAWHRGIWYGHGDINGEDFWREKPDHSTSRLALSGQPKLSGNAFEARLAMMTPKGKRMGTVGERFAFSAEDGNVLIDSTISVIADVGEALRFGDSDDGGFAFRLSDEFRQDRGAELLNSEGLAGTEKIWGKPARWVKYSATVAGGKRAGVVMLDHPSNLRHPTRWHARGYSLCAANPFALRSFTNDRNADGSYTVASGATLRLRYLVIIHEGDLSREDVERYYATFKGQS